MGIHQILKTYLLFVYNYVAYAYMSYTEHCVQSPDRHTQHVCLKRQTAYHTGVRSHTPLSINEMCTHCRQPIRILLARQLANHKLITICLNLEWGTYDVSHLQILTCEVAVSTGGQCNMSSRNHFAKYHRSPPQGSTRIKARRPCKSPSPRPSPVRSTATSI